MLMLIYYKYEQEIKDWLRARDMCLSFSVLKGIDERTEYNAVVSYLHKHVELVEKRLLPKMEDSPPYYEVCLHARNWFHNFRKHRKIRFQLQEDADSTHPKLFGELLGCNGISDCSCWSNETEKK